MELTEQEIFDTIQPIISRYTNIEQSEITMMGSFINDLLIDELDMVKIIMAIENEFVIKIPDEDAEKIETVGDLVKYIAKHIK
jgi:acyl carrier protein